MKRISTLLIIDDQPDIRLSIAILFNKEFDKVDQLEHPAKALSAIANFPPDVVLLDMNFSRGLVNGEEGMTWLKKIITHHPDIPVVMMTAYGDVELAVKAVKLGAFDFVLKPWDNERFVSVIREAKKVSSTKAGVSDADTANRKNIIGNSPQLLKCLKQAEKVAVTDANVLLLGENGTGKDLFASYIHAHSLRSSRQMSKVDLGSVPDSLFESELFGYRKGAFTDARQDKTGIFEFANGSTLFLDEIGNASINSQAKLLSVLQNRKMNRLGSVVPIDVDVRLICATNQDPTVMMENGIFRRDLLYRIRTVEITLPPLRERGEDIQELANYFLDLFSTKYKRVLRFSESCIDAIQSYQWPGNVREMQHSVERAVILCDGEVIFPEDMIIAGADAQHSMTEGLLSLEELERSAIERTLSKNNGKISPSAKDLGLTRASLYRRIYKYGL